LYRNQNHLAKALTDKHSKFDVLINNAGIFKTPDPMTQNGLDEYNEGLK